MSVTVKQIDDILDKMGTDKLSSVLPLVYSVALSEKDYVDFCVLYFWASPFCGSAEANSVVNREMISFLMQDDVPQEHIVKICELARKKYLDMRTIDEKNCMLMSAKEMEDHFLRFDKYEQIVELPAGMAPIDVCHYKDSVASEKLMLLNERQRFEQQYSLLQSFMISKLTGYRIKAAKNEMRYSKNFNTKNVFIIHGHDDAKLFELRTILKERFNLNPIILREQPEEGMTIIEKFEKYAEQCSYAFALFTPDDIVSVNGEEYFQARPNVIFELGWFYANLGRSRVCILERASEKSKIFSDLQGILRIQFRDNIEEKYLNIERELRSVEMI